jgi:hypothetical protein
MGINQGLSVFLMTCTPRAGLLFNGLRAGTILARQETCPIAGLDKAKKKAPRTGPRECAGRRTNLRPDYVTGDPLASTPPASGSKHCTHPPVNLRP